MVFEDKIFSNTRTSYYEKETHWLSLFFSNQIQISNKIRISGLKQNQNQTQILMK